MSTKSLLIVSPGAPFTLLDLMPNMRLMALAGALCEAGHDTEIWDGGTVEALDSLYATRVHVMAHEVYERLRQDGAGKASLRVRVQIRTLDRLLADAQDRLYVRVLDRVRRRKPDFIVFDVVDEKAWSACRRISHLVHARFPRLPSFVCGPFADAFAEPILACEQSLDGVLFPDAELAVVELASRIGAGGGWGSVPNLHCREQPFCSMHREFSQDLDALPSPQCHVDMYPALSAHQKLLLLPIEDARGSVFPSNYRVQEISPPLRSRSPNSVARLMQRTGEAVGSWAFHHLCAEAPPSLLRGVAAEVVSRNLGLVYSRACHVQSMDAATAAALAGSGARCVSFRVDSGSQRLLEDHYGHTFGVSAAEQALEAAVGAGLHVSAHMTYPCPVDDIHSCAETQRFLARAKPHGVVVHAPRVLPQSRWFTAAGYFGYNRCDECVGAWLSGDRHGHAYARWRKIAVPFSAKYMRSGTLGRLQGELLASVSLAPPVYAASAEAALVAQLCGYRGRETAYLAQLDQLLTSGDAWNVAAVVSSFNHGASAAGQRRLAPFSTTQLAMGN